MTYFHTVIAAVDAKLQTDLGVPVSIPIALFGLFILLILGLSIVGWIVIFVAKANGLVLPLRTEKHSPPPWGAVDLLVISLVWFVTQIVSGVVLRRLGLLDAERGEVSLTVMAMSQALSMTSVLFGAVWLIAWFRSESQFSGWSMRHIFYDVLLGLVVFILCAPALWLLMALATLATKVEYSHPLMKAIQADPSNMMSILSAFWVAVIVAPFFEEFGFRVLLQGFFQSLADKSNVSKALIAFVGRGRTALFQRMDHDLPVSNISTSDDGDVGKLDSSSPYAPGTVARNLDNHTRDSSEAGLYTASETADNMRPKLAGQTETVESTRAYWPVLLSGFLFGLAHWDYGVSWIPLVFFGIVLGWLYQKTNRIWPSLVAHMFCNFIGVTGITLQALHGGAPGN